MIAALPEARPALLPEGFPTWPEPFGAGWIALPAPFGQVHRGDIGPCSCGEPIRTLYLYLYRERLKAADAPEYSVRTAVACIRCLPPPRVSVVVGKLDTATGRVEIVDPADLKRKEVAHG